MLLVVFHSGELIGATGSVISTATMAPTVSIAINTPDPAGPLGLRRLNQSSSRQPPPPRALDMRRNVVAAALGGRE